MRLCDTDLTDKVAQESADSSASLHPIHSPDKATIEHHKANPGPVISQNMPEAESRDDLKKRAEELNKKD